MAVTTQMGKSNFMQAYDIIHGYHWSNNSSIVWALGQVRFYMYNTKLLQKQELDELPKLIEFIKQNNISSKVAKRVETYFKFE